MKIVTADITGSLIVNGVNVTDNVVSSSVFSGSIAGRVTNLEQFSASLDATFATDASVTASILVLSQSVQASQAALSSSYTATSASYVITSGSYAAASASLSIRTTNLEATASVNTQASASFAAYSASMSTRLTTDETSITTLTNASASFAAQSASLSTRLTTDETNFNTTSGSIAGRVTLIEGQYATTGSNTFTKPQQITDVSNAIGFTSTASLYTDGGLRVKGAAYISGTAYFNDVVVYGTSSIEYITSSQLAIGTNIITLNTDTPSIRYGGISVYDSGSNNLSTGSLFWDSEKDKWIYSNPSGSTYDGGMLISGPRNTSGLGNEVGTTSCALMMGQGGDHITSSAIFSYGNATCFYGNSIIENSGAACFASTVCAPSFVGGTISGTTGTFSSNVVATGSLIIAPSSNVELQVQSTGLTIGNISTDTHNVTGSLNITGSLRTVGNSCFTSVCSPTFIGGTATFALGSGTCINITTNGNNGTQASPLQTSLNFRGLNNNLNGQIRVDDISGTAQIGSMQFYTWNSAQVLSLTLGHTGIACFASTVCAPRLQVSNTSAVAVIEGTATNGEGTLTIAGKNSGGTSRSAIFKYDNVDVIRIATADAIPMRFETSDVTRLTFASTGIACFACQVCAPAFISSASSTLNGLVVSCNVSSNCFTGITVVNSAGGGAECSRAGIAFQAYDWVQSAIWHGRQTSAAFEGALLFGTNPNTANLGVGGVCTRLRIDNSGVACFACQVCTPNLRAGSSGITTTGNLSWNSGDGVDWYIRGQANGPAIRMKYHGGSTNRSAGLGWVDNNSTYYETLCWQDTSMFALGILCSNNVICASTLATNAGGLNENFSGTGGGHITRYFAAKFIPENTTQTFFRITTSGASATYINLVGTNAGVGWYSSQIYQAANSAYWGGFVGSGTSVSLIGTSAGYISSTATDNSGNQTFCVTVANNGTGTSSLIFAYITTVTYGNYNTTFTQL